MKNLLLVFVLLFSIGTFAVNPAPLDSKEKIEIVKPDIAKNFVNLTMAVNDLTTFSEHQLNSKFYFDEATPIDKDVFKKLRPVSFELSKINTSITESNWLNDFRDKQHSIIQKLSKDHNKAKEELFVSRIKEFIPDFDITKPQKYKTRIFSSIENYETSYFLKEGKENIRLITFVKNPLPIKYEGNNLSFSFKETYY